MSKNGKCAHPLHLHLVSRSDLWQSIMSFIFLPAWLSTEGMLSTSVWMRQGAKQHNLWTVPTCMCGVPMKDSNFIRNFNMHSYPAIMDMTSQDLFMLFLTTKALHLTMKYRVFFFCPPQLSSHNPLRIAELLLKSWYCDNFKFSFPWHCTLKKLLRKKDHR